MTRTTTTTTQTTTAAAKPNTRPALLDATLKVALQSEDKLNGVVADIVTTLCDAYRASNDGNPVLASHDSGRDIDVALLHKWATGKATKTEVSMIKAALVDNSPSVAAYERKRLALVNAADKMSKALKDPKADPKEVAAMVAEHNLLVNDGNHQRKANLTGLYRRFERACMTFVVAIKHFDTRVIASLRRDDKSATLIWEEATEGKRPILHKFPVINSVGEATDALRYHALSPKDREAIDTASKPTAGKSSTSARKANGAAKNAKAGATQRTQTPEKIVGELAADPKSRRYVIDAASSVVAGFSGDTKPRGDMLDALLSLYSSLNHIFTADQIAAWEKKNAAK